jgi:hypothetical protein
VISENLWPLPSSGALRRAGGELLAGHHPEEEEMTKIMIVSLALLYVVAGAVLGIVWITYLIIQALSQ